MLDSGVLTAWRGANKAPAGGMPVMEYEQVWGSYYENRTIGVTRYYTAQQHGDRNAYRVTQKQDVIDDDGLPATDLTLERDDGLDAGKITGSVSSSD